MGSALLSLENPVVIAHRGGSGLGPENTTAAFDSARSLGVAIECDVHLSSDGQPVVIHDATLDRTTDATGPVSALTAVELATVDAGCRFRSAVDGAAYTGPRVGVPTLADVLDRSGDLPVVVEIKGRDPSVVRAVIGVVGRHGTERPILVAGFGDDVLSAVRTQAPSIATSASMTDVKRAIRRAWFRLAPVADGYALFQVPMRHGARRVLTRRFARAARRAGVPVHAWVVDDPIEMRMLLDWGVTGIITDRPDVAQAVLADWIAGRDHGA